MRRWPWRRPPALHILYFCAALRTNRSSLGHMCVKCKTSPRREAGCFRGRFSSSFRKPCKPSCSLLSTRDRKRETTKSPSLRRRFATASPPSLLSSRDLSVGNTLRATQTIAMTAVFWDHARVRYWIRIVMATFALTLWNLWVLRFVAALQASNAMFLVDLMICCSWHCLRSRSSATNFCISV